MLAPVVMGRGVANSPPRPTSLRAFLGIAMRLPGLFGGGAGEGRTAQQGARLACVRCPPAGVGFACLRAVSGAQAARFAEPGRPGGATGAERSEVPGVFLCSG